MKLETQLRQSWVGHARLCVLYNALLNVSYSFGERYHLETTRCASSQSIHTFFFFLALLLLCPVIKVFWTVVGLCV